MSRRQILIIDDEQAVHDTLGRCLHELGFVAHSAFDGRQGLKALQEHPGIHIVLTDVRIPGMDGLAVLREIKRKHPAIQVILMTAFSNKNMAIQALRAGADEYLEKPLQLDELTEILERSLRRRRLQSLSTRWQEFLEHLPIGFFWCTPEGIVEGVSATAQQILSCTLADAVGRALWEIPGLEGVRELFHSETDHRAEHSIEVQAQGCWLVLQKIDTTRETVSPSTFIVVTDVSEQKAIQRDLARLSREFEARVEERTRSLSEELDFSQRLLDTAGVLIAYFDHHGKLTRLNKFAEELTSFTREEAEQLFVSFRSQPASPLYRIFDPHSRDDISGMIAEFPTQDGHKRLLSWTTRRLPGRGARGGRLVIGIDVTEQKQLEATLQNYNVLLENLVESRSSELRQKNAQLIHTARLASLGEIAAGIAHEMKQPLNVISITADLIKLLQKNGSLTDELLQSHLEKIRATVDRMANTINHLRGFTHIDSANFKSLTIREAVDGALSILGEQIRLDDINVVVDVPDNLPPFLGELSQIEQVLVNLLQNARDTIEDRAQASETSGASSAQPRRITIRAGNSGSDNFVEIVDTGTGMEDDVRRRLFEPFFTTKDSTRGTGLGLSISMNIVQSHGGTIQVKSKSGVGSTFRVILPVYAPDQAHQ